MLVVSATLRLIGRRTGHHLISMILAPENANQQTVSLASFDRTSRSGQLTWTSHLWPSSDQ